ncbi:hypothetical protein [Halorubrum californiense]|uniref:hypothetical protein n=1 Tax=Halorubrum californiense TaxID=416585 RepID=UPI0012684948|nr:hypothetical protein [Halorubrum californiense]
MPTRVAGVLGSYDFLGKSVPGIVLITGLASLFPGLPTQLLSQSQNGVTFTVLATIALILVFTGLVVGQAVHTLADNVEKILYWVGRETYNRYYMDGFVREEFRENHPIFYLIGYCFYWPLNWLILRWIRYAVRYIVESLTKSRWFIRRYWGIHDSFKSHRRLFEDELGWYFSDETKRLSSFPNISYEQFSQCCEDEFGINLGKLEGVPANAVVTQKEIEYRQLYSMIASLVSTAEQGRANGFQARYSFCRGMWVVLLFMILAYLLTLFPPIVPAPLDYNPIVFELLNRDELGVVIAVMSVMVVIFVDAAGDYKRNFIEYLIADFCTVVRNRTGFSDDSEDD